MSGCIVRTVLARGRPEVGLAFLLSLAACAAANTPEACRITRVAEIPLRMVRNLPVVDAEVDGKPARLMLDTGADGTVINQDALGRLGLEHDYTMTTYATGLGARTGGWPTKPVPVMLGAGRGGSSSGPAGAGSTLSLKPERLFVVSMAWPARLREQVDGLLGGRTLSEYDVDIDMAQRRIAFYEPRRCPDGPPPFEGPSMTLRATNNGAYRLAIPIQVDGVELSAAIDTGASATLIDGRQSGLTPADLASDRTARISTADPVGLSVHSHRFRRMQVGTETIENPVVAVGEIDRPGYNALLGSDYWRTRRLWISYAGRTITISPPRPRPSQQVQPPPQSSR